MQHPGLQGLHHPGGQQILIGGQPGIPNGLAQGKILIFKPHIHISRHIPTTFISIIVKKGP